MSNSFFLLVLLTVLGVRTFNYLLPIASPTIAGFRLHHYMYGLFLVGVSLLVPSWRLFAVGLGLAIDETTFVLIGGKTHADNYSLPSLVGTALLLVLVFVMRQELTKLFS